MKKLYAERVASDFGNRLRKARMDTGLTVEQLAEKLNLSISSVYAFEHKRVLPKDESIKMFCDALSVSFLWLKYGDETILEDEKCYYISGCVEKSKCDCLDTIDDVVGDINQYVKEWYRNKDTKKLYEAKCLLEIIDRDL